MRGVTLSILVLAVLFMPMSVATADEDKANLEKRIVELEQIIGALMDRIAALETELARARKQSPDQESERSAAFRAALDAAEDGAAVEQVVATYPLLTADDYAVVVERLMALGPDARAALLAITRRYVQGPGSEDPRARAVLGQRRFEVDISMLHYRDHPFVLRTEIANRKRWFGPHEDNAYEKALQAARMTKSHLRRLETDHVYRAVDQLKAFVSNYGPLAGYDLVYQWADPFVVCRVKRGRRVMSDAGTTVARLEQRLEKIEALRDESHARLAERGYLYRSIYNDLISEFGEVFDWRPLMSPWGGRPDLPLGRRSFQDGSPLVVLVFDRDTSSRFRGGHLGTHETPISVPRDWVAFVEREKHPGDELQAYDQLFEGTQVARRLIEQLTRQRRGWRDVQRADDWFSAGFARYVVTRTPMLRESELADEPARSIQRVHGQFASRRTDYPIFPISTAIQFTSRGQLRSWGTAEWEIQSWDVMELFLQQAHAFTALMLDGPERDRYLKVLEQYLDRGVGRQQAATIFRKTFGMRHDDEFEDLQAAFEAEIQRLITVEIPK